MLGSGGGMGGGGCERRVRAGLWEGREGEGAGVEPPVDAERSDSAILRSSNPPFFSSSL